MTNDGARILVVDDSPTVRRLAELILTQQGYTVHTAEDGEVGLKLAREVRPAAILVDYVMPKMNGHLFCKSLRSEAGMKEIPIILISSKGEVVGKAFEEEFGVVHYFNKPFEPEGLVRKLDEVLQVEKPPLLPDTPPASPAAAPEQLLSQMQERFDRIVRQYFQKDFPLLMKNVLSDTLRETGLVKHDTLVMSGNLSQIPLPDIINFTYNSRLTGRLSVFSRSTFGEIFLENGMFVFATVSKTDGKHLFLLDLMCRDGKIQCGTKDIAQIVTEARENNRPVGRVLVEKGIITENELMEYLRQHAMEAFNGILEVKEGTFYMEEDDLPLNLQDISFRLPLIFVLMEGLRLLDEKQVATTEFQDESVVLMRLITNEDALDDFTLHPKELEFFSIIDGKKTLREIIQDNNFDPVETKRICYALSKVGLLKRKTS